ncbi:MAG: hypothetical protein NTY14_00550 [Candidatus Omnitrophica bacterium]|nr:hypothetical protein [Candidatus Omnitrophota bacterium]
MATKEEVLEDFLKCFRISLNFILLYAKDHKSFLKAVADLRVKTVALFVYLHPIEINFSADALAIEGVVYSKMSLHRELAALFHQRKIQSLIIRRGITLEELVVLMDKLALAPRDIIKSGGLAEIISGIIKNPHFTVVDLDYSQLLRGEGEEVKDIWLFMLHGAVATEDLKKFREFAKSFEDMVQKCKVRDLLENNELNQDLHKFLDHLKKTDHEKFISSSRAILKFILKDKSVIMDDEKIKKLKAFVPELGIDDYSQVLWNEIVTDANFDVSSFQFFSKFLGEDEHQKVADNLSRNLSGQEGRKMPANVSRKVKELFSSSAGESSISEIYRRAISAVGVSTIADEGAVFDHKQVIVNYHYILLNLFSEEKNIRQLEFLVNKLSQEWDKIAQERDMEYLKCLGEVIQKKTPSLNIELFHRLSKNFYNFIEAFIWEESIPAGFEAFFETMDVSSFGVEVYFKKIFEEDKVNARILKAFFRFFPNKFPEFCERLKDKRSDIDFVVKVLESLKEVDPALGLPVMELIFAFSNDIVKVEILRSMAATGKYNREFVFEVLKGSGNFMKKEALAVFSQQQDHQRAMELLFLIPNPWGKKNAVLEENLLIVGELFPRAGSSFADG